MLLVLGTWQLDRRTEKHALLAAIAANAAAPPVETIGADAGEFRRVRLTGTVDPTRALGLINRLRDGVMGVALVVPLTLPDGTLVMVDRGWRPALDRSGAPHQETVAGMLRRPLAAGWAAPENQPARDLWLRLDPAAMAAKMGLPADRLSPFYVLEAPAGLPEIADNHLQYAVTWYSFAATLVIIYLVFVRRARREGGQP